VVPPRGEPWFSPILEGKSTEKRGFYFGPGGWSSMGPLSRNRKKQVFMKAPGHAIADLLRTLEGSPEKTHCTGLSGSEKAYLLYRLQRQLQGPLLVVCAEAKEAQSMERDLRFFSKNGDRHILAFPSYDILPYKPLSYHAETSSRRIGVLYRLMTASEPYTVITTVSGLIQKVIPKEALSRYCEYIIAGEEMERDDLIKKLMAGGYQETALVEEPGDYAVRGGLIDVFPPLCIDPIRIEFFGDMVESIRSFSAKDQLSRGSLSELAILPARETVLEAGDIDKIIERIHTQGHDLEMPGLRIEDMSERIKHQEQFPGISGLLSLVFPSPGTLFDYVVANLLPVLVDPVALETSALAMEDMATKNYLAAVDEGHICVKPENLYIRWSEAEAALNDKKPLSLKPFPVEDGTSPAYRFVVENNHLVTQQLRARHDPEALLRPLAEWIGHAQDGGLAVRLICRTVKQAKSLNEFLRPYGIGLQQLDAFPDQMVAQEGPGICIGELSSGFVWDQENLAVITEDEIFGPKQWLPKPLKKVPKTERLAFEALKSGDFIVHVDHGVGQYEGLVKLEVGQQTNDFLLLQYKDGDKLYVPVDRMNCVQKYVGVEGIAPSLDKMGGKSWGRVKERVKKSIRKMAGELLKLYAWRKVQEGWAFSASDQHFREFEAAFEYTETPDQNRAVQDVMADMEAGVPMDRLICGDVGYGKTEIAVRAAFRAVWDNKQVAFLVPTTVLAEQHFQTFKNRFEPYPVEIATLSRFRSGKEQRNAVEKLKAGQIDVVIGTHRLLQKDVAFRDLGLVIIDEEQRFGVAHKEKLKKLRRTVDVLALTATPIPRTLHMSLMGIRDLSVISTPPEYRYPIKTYISVFDERVVAEAIHRELQRGGQVFFVHNNIRTISSMARRIEELVPGVRIGVAHGRLDDDALENAMLEFVNRQIEVLVCTTIIESGLDFPSANTILINRADKFGLAQIYQLRGRVGRADEQAYAYLFIPHEGALTRDAQKRLKVLMEHSDLGSGFQIAMSDLQIRGGGTILGPVQSGQIASVGHEMYLQLMERTVKELKGEPVESEIEPEITANLSAYIPEGYVAHIDQRMTIYRRLSSIADQSALTDIRKELVDRYGPLPDEVEALLEKITLKILCKKLGIARMELGDRDMALTFSEKTPIPPERIAHLVQKDPQRFRMTPDCVLRARVGFAGSGSPTEFSKKVLQELAS
jgi:transcription-repair coupling factor (superfamily II helicase)